jgi:hypothetical protein
VSRLNLSYILVNNLLNVGLSQYDQQELQHFLDELGLLQLFILGELFASSILDFLEDLGAQNELEGSVDDRVDIFCVLFLTTVVEEDVDNLEAKKLEVEEMGVFGSGWLFFLLSDNPVDQGNQVIEPVG